MLAPVPFTFSFDLEADGVDYNHLRDKATRHLGYKVSPDANLPSSDQGVVCGSHLTGRCCRHDFAKCCICLWRPLPPPAWVSTDLKRLNCNRLFCKKRSCNVIEDCVLIFLMHERTRIIPYIGEYSNYDFTLRPGLCW